MRGGGGGGQDFLSMGGPASHKTEPHGVDNDARWPKYRSYNIIITNEGPSKSSRRHRVCGKIFNPEFVRIFRRIEANVTKPL